MRLSSRRADDADVIRARLRALLTDTRTGWVPGHDAPDPDPDPGSDAGSDDRGSGDDAPGSVLRAPSEEDDDPAGGNGRPRGMGRHRAPAPTARLDPGRAGARALWTAAALAVAALLVWTWLDRPQVEPAPDGTSGSSVTASVAPPEPSPDPASPPVGEVAQTATTVVVAVVGEVVRPGLVTLPSGARVADAIEAAGGLLPEADPASVNLAAVIADGQQVAVGVPGAPGAATPDGGAAAPAGGAATGDGLVDVNTAPAAELDTLPGIGPVLAQRIVEHREQAGPFGSVDQLQDVTGIGPTVLERIADRVRV